MIGSRQPSLYTRSLLKTPKPSLNRPRSGGVGQSSDSDGFIPDIDSNKATMRYRHLEDVIITSDVNEKEKQALETPYRYAHLKQEDRDLVKKVLSGRMAAENVPKLRSKVIKVFISSTFTDMIEERNALAMNVYPKLRDYCRDKYGVDFQAVDMRWGIPPEAKNDHSVIDLCMAELFHCQDLSIGPNFVVLIGQKYGYIPVPPSIDRMDFEAMNEVLKLTQKSPTLLEKCYMRDQNVTPSVYRLLDVNKCADVVGKAWDKVETDLRDIISQVTKEAVAKGEMAAETRRRLVCSVTEQEIHHGLLNITHEKIRSLNCTVLVRDIADLFDNLNCVKAKRYCDVEPETNELNGDAKLALNQLRTNIQANMPKFNTDVAIVQWTPNGIDPVVHKDYLNRVCNHFYHTIKVLADRNMQDYSELAQDELYHEVVQHWTLVSKRTATFVGRTNELAQLEKYLKSETNQALVVHGESGVGKTSFMAKAISMTRSLYAAQSVLKDKTMTMKTQVVHRFIGITPKSSNIQQLLFSVCHQLAFITGGYRHQVPEDYKALKRFFIDLVQRGDFPGVVVLFLDSLDQLGTSNGGDKLDWLPSRIANNVKIVLSTLPRKLDILNRLKNKIDYPMLELSLLPPADCEAIMRCMMDNSNRSVTLPQWRVIQEAFQRCTLPLFITLTFQEASRWRSFDEVSRASLEYTLEASINKLFDRLEAKHGKVFVSRALGYVTAAKNGLSETELEDILSLDDLVLSALFTLWDPPIRRVPPSLWPRLYLDIRAFLVEREADDIVVLGWYHQQFLDSATSRYLSDYLDYNQIHRNIADYYLGCWSGTIKKPFLFGDSLVQRLKLPTPHGMARRYVPEQPLVFRATEIEERFNLRKMAQLPYSLIHSCQFDKVKADCLCNYEWLHTKLRATSLQQVIADFSMLDDKESDLVADALRMSGSALSLDPDALGVEISGRLLPHIHRFHWIKKLVMQCDLESQRRCPLVPNCQIYTAPGGPLQYECEMDANISSSIDVDVFNSPDGILMTAKPFYSTNLKVWELAQGEPRQDMQLPVGEVYPTKDGKYLAILKGGSQVLVFKTDCGELQGRISTEYGDVLDVSIGHRYLAFNIDRGVGPYVLDLWECTLVHKFNSMSQAVAINCDDTHIAYNSGTLVLVHTFPLMERRCVGQASDVPIQLIFNRAASKCYILTRTKLLQVMTFDATNRKSTTNDIICDLGTVEFKLSHNEKYILVRSQRCLFLVCTKKEKLHHRLERIHPGVFMETMTAYTGADFNPTDEMVVASRYTYVFVWCTKTGDPLRILQASLSPIIKIYTSDTINKAVTLLKDNTLQVWNLDNLDADILHANQIMKTSVRSLSVSCATKRIVCHDDKHPELKLVDLATGKVTAALLEKDCLHQQVRSVSLCFKGLFAVARNIPVPEGETDDYPRYNIDEDEDIHVKKRSKVIQWTLLTDDVLWNLDTKEVVHKVRNSRFFLSDNQQTTVGFVYCTFYSSFEWTNNMYSFTMWRPTSGILKEGVESEELNLQIPDMSEFISPPVLHSDNNTGAMCLVSLLQTCNKTFSNSRTESSRLYDNIMYIQNLDKENLSDRLALRMKDLLRFADDKDKLAHVALGSSNLLILTYMKGVDHFEFDHARGIVLPVGYEKATLVYDPVRKCVIQHVPSTLRPDSDLHLCQTTSSLRVDNHFRVFDSMTNSQKCQIKADLVPSAVRLALNGNYIIGLCNEKRSVSVYRSSDGQRLGRLYVHGTATCLEIGEDGRTVVVGTKDGRVLILSLVLEITDPYKEFIKNLPSRLPVSCNLRASLLASDKALLESDAANVESNKPELTRLAEKIRTDVKVAVKKQASFKSITKAVIAQKSSRACCIQ